MIKALFPVAFIMTFAFASAWAGERREFYNGIRGLGMGDSTIAVVNDETALASNPAALGRLRDFYGTVIDPELDISWKATDFYRKDPFSQPFKISDVMPTMLKEVGEYYHARGQVMPSFVAPNFGLGVLWKQTLDIKVTSASAADVFYQDDMALLLGYNIRLLGGRVKIGFTGKIISRVELNQTDMDPTQALDLPSLASAGFLTEGVGVGGDVGLILTAPWAMLPSLAVVGRNVGGMKYDAASGVRNKDATIRPTPDVQDVDVAVSLSPIHDKNQRSVWTIEYRGLLTAKDETDKAKLVHAGFEYNFGDIAFLRLGYNQRYWTAGLELASERLQFQFASYGEEVGDGTTHKEDRRYVVKAAYRF